MSDIKRRTISDKTIKLLYGKSGNRCAMYGCNNILVGNNNENLGEICHINDLNPNQIRYDSRLSERYLNSEENLILLCSRCHTQIDAKENANKYTVKYLKDMKCRHEKFVQEAMNKKTIIRPPSFLKNYNFEKIAKKYYSDSGYKIKKKDIQEKQNAIQWILENFLSMNQESRSVIYGIMSHTTKRNGYCIDIKSLQCKVDIGLEKYSYILKILEQERLIRETKFTDEENSCFEDNDGYVHFVHENYQYKALHGIWYLQMYGKLIYTIYNMFIDITDSEGFYDFMVNEDIEKINKIL